MKKFTLFIAAIMASAAMFAEVTVEKLVQVTPETSVYDVAVSPDGSTLYAAKQKVSVEVYDAKTLELKGSLKAPTALPAYGSAVAVDDNGAIYTVYALISKWGELTVYKWADANADAQVFTKIGNGTDYGVTTDFRCGYGFDVKINNEGNGFILYPLPSYKNAETTFVAGASVIYVPVTNNEAGTPQLLTLSETNWGIFPDVTIVDETTFWYDANATQPQLCTLSLTDGVASIASIKSFPNMTEPIMAPHAVGITDFELAGTRYVAVGSNNHASTVDGEGNPNGRLFKNLAMLASVEVEETISATWLAQLPEGGFGTNTNDVAAVRAAHYVNGNEAWVWTNAKSNGMAVTKITASSTTTAIDNTTVAPQVQKIIRDGQVLIIRDGKTFNMMGQEVR